MILKWNMPVNGSKSPATAFLGAGVYPNPRNAKSSQIRGIIIDPLPTRPNARPLTRQKCRITKPAIAHKRFSAGGKVVGIIRVNFVIRYNPLYRITSCRFGSANFTEVKRNSVVGEGGKRCTPFEPPKMDHIFLPNSGRNLDQKMGQRKCGKAKVSAPKYNSVR